MSDYDDEMMYDDDEEDYDLEYSEDSNSEPDVDLENQYYNSKALKEENPKAALESFQRVLDLEAVQALTEAGFTESSDSPELVITGRVRRRGRRFRLRLDLARSGNVGRVERKRLHIKSVIAQRRGGSLQLARVAAIEDDPRARLGETGCERQANALRTAGNERSAPGKIKAPGCHSHLSRSFATTI